MYNKYLLIEILFVCTSCELSTDKPLEILYTGEDKLNMKLFLINIPSSVKEYHLTIVDSSKNWMKTIEVGHVTFNEIRKRINIYHDIEAEQYGLVKLWKADGTLYSSRYVFHLFNDNSIKEKDKHKCLNQKQACHIQIDFQSKFNNPKPVIVIEIDIPDRYKNLNLNEHQVETLHFYENETFSLRCYQNEVTKVYNVTWTQEFSTLNTVVSEQLTGNTSFLLQITLQKYDEDTVVFCTGEDNEISTRITFKLKDKKEINKVYFNKNKSVTHNCSEGKLMLKRNANDFFQSYVNNVATIHDKGDNGSILFCMKHIMEKVQLIAKSSREINNEVMYIYKDNLTTESYNIIVWMTVPAVVVVVVVIVLTVWCAYSRRRSQHSQHPKLPLPELDISANVSQIPEPVYEEIVDSPPSVAIDRKSLQHVAGVRFDRKTGVLTVNEKCFKRVSIKK